MALITAAYEIVFVGVLGGTPGKLIQGIRVTTADGQPCGLARSARRFLPQAATFVPGLGLAVAFSVWGISALRLFRHPLRRSLFDEAAGTVVVRRR
jgi:uncharacterized RDD family membrane protein YckC